MAAGGRGLSPGRAPSPVGMGSGCQSGRVIAPPPNMEDDSATDRAPRASSVRVPVRWTGSGPVGRFGASVLLPVSQRANRLSGLVTAPALTPPPPPVRPETAAVERTRRRTPARTCLTAQWTEGGGPGQTSLPVLLPVGWGSSCPAGGVIVLPPNMAASPVLERTIEPESATPTRTVQWTGGGPSGPSGPPAGTPSEGRTSAA